MTRSCGAAGSLSLGRPERRTPFCRPVAFVVGAILLVSCNASGILVSRAPNTFSDAFSRCAYTDFGFATGRVDAGGQAAFTIDRARGLRAMLRGPVIVLAFGDRPHDVPARPADQRLANARKAFVVRRLNAAGIGISSAAAVAGNAPGMRTDHSTAMMFFDCRPPG